MATEKPRFSLTMDELLLERVERYQDNHNISTKSKAIQALVEIGLKDLQQSSAAMDTKKSPTEVSPQDTKKSPSLENGDEELLNLYHRLDRDDRSAIKYEIRGMLLTEKY